jgi:hypothetical protein
VVTLHQTNEDTDEAWEPGRQETSRNSAHVMVSCSAEISRLAHIPFRLCGRGSTRIFSKARIDFKARISSNAGTDSDAGNSSNAGDLFGLWRIILLC